MAIFLTEEQRRAVAEQHGKAVEVIDPASKRSYMLVPAESCQPSNPGELDVGPSQANSAAPGAGVTSPSQAGTCEVRPLRQRLADLPTPPEVAEAAKRHCKRVGACGAKEQRHIEEEIKLQYYYGGQAVSYLPASEGRVIVAAGRRDSEAYDRQLASLSAAERRAVVLAFPPTWNDTANEVLTPFAYEG